VTPDETRIKAIEQRVRRSICETYNSEGGMTIEGRVLKEDFDYLMASLYAWKFTAKIMGVE
jgi:hypothetical protein